MWLSRLYLYFLLFSFAGWIFECVWNIIVKHEWENRGFLYGPVCPIYGVGAAGIIGVGLLCNHLGVYTMQIPAWKIFASSFIGSAVLEYATHYALEQRFHAVWWDYSNMPLNINGRVCLPASTLFGLAGVFLIKAAMPFLETHILPVSPVLIEAMAMIALVVISVDATLTISALTDFAHRVEFLENSMNHYMDGVVDGIQVRMENFQKKEDNAEEMDRRFLESAVNRMSYSYRNAIKRVRSFKAPKVIAGTSQRTREIAVRIQEIIRNRGYRKKEN